MADLTPEKAAARLRSWANAGFNPVIVDALVTSLEFDKRESQGRAPHKTGALAKTIRVIKPKVASAQAKGFIAAKLSAGSRGRKGVAYARVHQEGGQTGPHMITARRAKYDGGGNIRTTGVLAFKVSSGTAFARFVRHPGARFKRLNYLQIQEARLGTNVNNALSTSAEKALSG